MSLFLCMRINWAVFKRVGYIPEEKERLKISTSCSEISFLCSFNILVGVLFGPKEIMEIMEIVSSLSVGLKIELIL